jgi:hypothetical protein
MAHAWLSILTVHADVDVSAALGLGRALTSVRSRFSKALKEYGELRCPFGTGRPRVPELGSGDKRSLHRQQYPLTGVMRIACTLTAQA